MTSVQGCEDDRQKAWDVNVKGTANIVKACESYRRSSGGFRFPYLVHMSTPCVFSGREGNYTEDSIPYPVNFYGLTKAVAEQLVLNSGVSSKLIVRANFVPKGPWPYPKAFEDRLARSLRRPGCKGDQRSREGEGHRGSAHRRNEEALHVRACQNHNPGSTADEGQGLYRDASYSRHDARYKEMEKYDIG